MTEKSELFLAQQDAVLAQIITQTSFPNPVYDWGHDPYVALLESIVSQQLSVRAADTIFKRFCQLFPDGYPTAATLLTFSDEMLRSAGLSRQKISYLRSVAAFTQTHSLAHSRLAAMTDEEVVQYLLPIRGVGRWTVEMLLIFVLERTDVFPVDDLVIRQKMLRAYPAETAGLQGRALIQTLTRIADAWRPYRSLASRYLWAWKPQSAIAALR